MAESPNKVEREFTVDSKRVSYTIYCEDPDDVSQGVRLTVEKYITDEVRRGYWSGSIDVNGHRGKWAILTE